ncbi:hypothetical protein E4J66_05950 [Actinomyces viscosus]|uniref:LemA family n=3 Tax=Actinomyces viscosus TaxID=1656 RepID=A0A448PIR6_ACTVI|nr:hypothetical protein [Actinomyces viscosus]TFH52929.1 hypothetical protein E4J66_05950 [Actinomyces viscosus]VEI14792.1 Uncharacterised protein [Actinomyces viscosus]
MATMTTAMTEAAGLSTGAGQAVPMLSWAGPATPVPVWSVVVLLVGLAVAIGWALYARAVRVDRLHRQVLGSRATLEAQLVHRAEAAADLATTRALDPASGLLLSRAAREALDAEGPIVDDGLDTSPRLDAAPDPAGGAAGTVRSARSRALIESDLSRVLRTVVSEPARRDLSEDPLSVPALERLDRACSRLVLARRFHNTHVSEAQALRSRLLVRVCHLAGHAPMPQTFDADDDTTPEVQPAHDDEVQPR